MNYFYACVAVAAVVAGIVVTYEARLDELEGWVDALSEDLADVNAECATLRRQSWAG